MNGLRSWLTPSLRVSRLPKILICFPQKLSSCRKCRIWYWPVGRSDKYCQKRGRTWRHLARIKNIDIISRWFLKVRVLNLVHSWLFKDSTMPASSLTLFSKGVLQSKTPTSSEDFYLSCSVYGHMLISQSIVVHQQWGQKTDKLRDSCLSNCITIRYGGCLISGKQSYFSLLRRLWRAVWERRDKHFSLQ